MPEIASQIRILSRALEAAGVHAKTISLTVGQLSNPPLALHFSHKDGALDGESWFPVEFDGDTAAMMLYLGQGRTWKTLTPTERRKAKRYFYSQLACDGLGVAGKGAPPIIDSALVLWCARVLAEALGLGYLKISRSVKMLHDEREHSGPPTGPHIRALIAALKIAQASLRQNAEAIVGPGDTVDFADPRHRETIAEIVKLDRNATRDRRAKVFSEICASRYLGKKAEDVAGAPQTFREAIMRARKDHLRGTKPRRPSKPGVSD
jgi:hypothetical protein